MFRRLEFLIFILIVAEWGQIGLGDTAGCSEGEMLIVRNGTEEQLSIDVILKQQQTTNKGTRHKQREIRGETGDAKKGAALQCVSCADRLGCVVEPHDSKSLIGVAAGTIVEHEAESRLGMHVAGLSRTSKVVACLCQSIRVVGYEVTRRLRVS